MPVPLDKGNGGSGNEIVQKLETLKTRENAQLRKINY